MDKSFFFERNLLALSRFDPPLCSRLSGAETTRGKYKFIDSRSGVSIPALVDSSGAAHPLHSLVDPRKEGKRLVSTLGNEGFLIIFGLGGAFHVEAALERPETEELTVIDFDIHGVAELLSSQEYISIFNDPRFRLLVDPSWEALEKHILDRYKPGICGGFALLPLRTRADFGRPLFTEAGEVIKSAIDAVSADYSVQAHFGKRWFSNIVRNLPLAEQSTPALPPIRSAAICAAGPSLDAQIPLLLEKKERPFIIAADTSLPSLLSAGLEPDAVVSIDCQHISYYHFMAGLPEHTLLFLDLASPPLVASRSIRPYFFSGGHPLTRYLSRYWRPIPELDTSGANVSYAALSLAEYLGARSIELYGADFSYPLGITYARGSYIRTLFENRQTRCASLEALHSAFLYRTPLSKQNPEKKSWYYETKALTMYRQRLEEKVRNITAKVYSAPGMGAPISLKPGLGERIAGDIGGVYRLFSSGKAAMGAREFLTRYQTGISALPVIQGPVQNYLAVLTQEENIIFTTLLPTAAALKKRSPDLNTPAVFNAVKEYCIGELNKVIK
ncbi:motility associated factor glycosyltransferase family protein [Treponema primitia]|uniref:motility associated factor glycosyltransferase family protein n=1 Tax=Treponema primitia TaxID=88058 RepID=UPI0002554F54|nr:6-hydroxymethylpterin diphosphokinase MptE-like protein [Treponema primitia]